MRKKMWFLIALSCLGIMSVKAEGNPEIKIPDKINKGETGKITVNNISNYTVKYQYKIITEEQKNKLNEAYKFIEEANTLEESYKSLKTECDNLGEQASSNPKCTTELPNLAKQISSKKESAYTIKSENNLLDDDNAWKIMTNNEFYLDAPFNGELVLVTFELTGVNGEYLYRQVVYKTQKIEAVSNEDQNINGNSTEEKNINTNKEKNPKTGDGIIILAGGFVVVLGTILVSLKKYKKLLKN